VETGTTNHDDYGNPFGVPGTICLFERSIGDPLWRHFEVFAQTPEPQPAEGRPATELVIRYVATVGNYDVRYFPQCLPSSFCLSFPPQHSPHISIYTPISPPSTVFDGLYFPARWCHAYIHWSNWD
jgi:Copper amine oxidase, enzyme domain